MKEAYHLYHLPAVNVVCFINSLFEFVNHGKQALLSIFRETNYKLLTSVNKLSRKPSGSAPKTYPTTAKKTGIPYISQKVGKFSG